MIEYIHISLTLIVAASCVAGWLGANVLLALASVFENRTGIRLTPPAPKEEKPHDGPRD